MRGALKTSPHGFTVIETLVALAIFVVIGALLFELALSSVLEQRRNARRDLALEAAANLLEAARASEWDALTPDWAKAQRLPAAVADRLPGSRLVVQVEPDAARPQIKRITVEIGWQQESKQVLPVKLITLRSARTAAPPGGKP